MAVRERKKRIDFLLKLLKSAEPPIDERQFISIASFNIGVSVPKIKEYLDLLKNMNVIQNDERELKWVNSKVDKINGQ